MCRRRHHRAIRPGRLEEWVPPVVTTIAQAQCVRIKERLMDFPIAPVTACGDGSPESHRDRAGGEGVIISGAACPQVPTCRCVIVVVKIAPMSRANPYSNTPATTNFPPSRLITHSLRPYPVQVPPAHTINAAASSCHVLQLRPAS
jgi:hypothetical protein